MTSMMNDSFETSYHRPSLTFFPYLDARGMLIMMIGDTGITTLKADKGLALQDIIAGLYDFIATIAFAAQTRVYLLDQLAQVEHRLSTGGSEKLQLTALLGATKT